MITDRILLVREVFALRGLNQTLYHMHTLECVGKHNGHNSDHTLVVTLQWHIPNLAMNIAYTHQ